MQHRLQLFLQRRGPTWDATHPSCRTRTPTRARLVCVNVLMATTCVCTQQRQHALPAASTTLSCSFWQGALHMASGPGRAGLPQRFVTTTAGAIACFPAAHKTVSPCRSLPADATIRQTCKKDAEEAACTPLPCLLRYGSACRYSHRTLHLLCLSAAAYPSAEFNSNPLACYALLPSNVIEKTCVM